MEDETGDRGVVVCSVVVDRVTRSSCPHPASTSVPVKMVPRARRRLEWDDLVMVWLLVSGRILETCRRRRAWAARRLVRQVLSG
jgi:hypothetical protein